MENTCAIHFWSIIGGREDRCPCARAWLWVHKAVNICLKNYSKVVLNTGRVCFLLDWPPGWSQNFGSAALYEGETTHLWAWSEASKGGKSFFWGPMKSIDHGFPLGLFHSRWTPLGSIGYSQAEDEASAWTGWPQTWIFSPKLYCDTRWSSKQSSKLHRAVGGKWAAKQILLLTLPVKFLVQTSARRCLCKPLSTVTSFHSSQARKKELMWFLCTRRQQDRSPPQALKCGHLDPANSTLHAAGAARGPGPQTLARTSLSRISWISNKVVK